MSTVPASLITVFSYTRFEDVFTKIVLLSVFTAVIPYLFSAAAQLYRLLVRGRAGLSPRRLARDVTVAALALAFSYWSIQGSGYQTVYYGLFVLLLAVPVYAWLKRGRGEYGDGTDVAFPAVPAAHEERAPETPASPRRLSHGPGTGRVDGRRGRNARAPRDRPRPTAEEAPP